MAQQTVHIQIRLLQMDQDLHSLPFQLHLLNTLLHEIFLDNKGIHFRYPSIKNVLPYTHILAYN